MNATKVYHHMEIAFWDVVIVILTRSQFIRSIAHKIYEIFFEDERRGTLILGIQASAAGLLFGVLLFGLNMLVK
jgi:hypothetical protein